MVESHTDNMRSWLGNVRDPRVSWIGDSLARGHTATAGAPVVWMARSVLEAIGRSAEFALPHAVDGELLGYWVTPGIELVVIDWSGFGSLLFHEPHVESAERYEPGDRRVATPTSNALRAPLGIWSTRPITRAPDASERTPLIHLLLERKRAWRARLAMLPRGRWPWSLLRRPRELELRVFSPPRY